MFVLRFFALVLLLLAAGACLPQGASAPATTASEASGVPGVPRAIERDVGTAYADPALQAYVDGVGQRLLKRSGIPGSYRFVVLDLPNANAHAVSNYVFVTRGLLAGLDDEAELAAALAHEVSHLLQRHAAQRAQARQGVLDAAIEAAAATGSVTVGRSVARDGLLALRRYSREQELEADRMGLTLLVKAGYRGDAMASLIEKLRRQSQLEMQLMGEAPDSVDRRSSVSTHPAPIERQEALRGLTDLAAPGENGRMPYLGAIDGLSVDDSPQEGFVRGNKFLHPVMRIGFEAPRDFRLFNDQDGVLGVGRDRSLIFFSCLPEPVPGSLAEWMRSQLKPTPTDIQTIEIAGAEAAIGARPRGSDTGLSQLRYVMVRRGERVCYFNLLSEGADRDQRIEVLVNAARTFHGLSNAELAALKPYRLKVVTTGGTSAAQIAQHLPYDDFKMQRLLVLNGVDSPAALMRQAQIKTIQP
ncbi:MAG: M48 family metalloprotease [Reyranellaceae bacterium]